MVIKFEVTVEATTQRTIIVEAEDFGEAYTEAHREVANMLDAIDTTVVDIQEIGD